MAPVHNRMPVVLDDEDVEVWLDPEVTDRAELQLLLRPSSDNELYAYPVSRLANSTRNLGRDVIARAAA